LLIDRLELANFVGVIPPARRTFIVEVPPDVIPAESANLVLALAWLEVEIRNIHLLEAERTLLRFLFIAPVRVLYACKDGGFCLK
jgi:hypothetical protein